MHGQQNIKSVKGTCIDDPGEVTEGFAKHIYTLCRQISAPLNSISVLCCYFLLLAPYYDHYIQKRS